VSDTIEVMGIDEKDLETWYEVLSNDLHKFDPPALARIAANPTTRFEIRRQVGNYPTVRITVEVER
jgi:hypothetical protein